MAYVSHAQSRAESNKAFMAELVKENQLLTTNNVLIMRYESQHKKVHANSDATKVNTADLNAKEVHPQAQVAAPVNEGNSDRFAKYQKFLEYKKTHPNAQIGQMNG